MTSDGKIVADMITTGTMSADRIQGLDGIMVTVGELGDYIRIDENGNMTFGNPNNEYQLQIENDRVGIYYNGSLISSWIQDKFTATQLNLGNFAFIPRENGSLGFRKIKGISLETFYDKYGVNMQDIYPIKLLVKNKDLIYKDIQDKKEK